MTSNRNRNLFGPGLLTLPHIEHDTAVIEKVKVPRERRAFFLTVETKALHDKSSDELSFSALSPEDRATFQLLLYLTYCCKGEVLQVTLENPDFSYMSPPIREDFAHGRMFCFVLNMDRREHEEGCARVTRSPARDGQEDEAISGDQLLGLAEVDVDMDVFRRERDDSDDDEEEDALEEAFGAFMRLQLVRAKASSLNNAMIVMRDGKDELKSIFGWIDIRKDSLNSSKLEKKTVRELQGSMYTPASSSSRQAVSLPETIRDLNLKALNTSIGRLTDSAGKGEGKELFRSLLSKLTYSQWTDQAVVRTSYDPGMENNVSFLRRLKTVARKLGRPAGRSDEVEIEGLLVFKYSLEKLVNREAPDVFARSLIHKHVSVSKSHVDGALREIRGKRRTLELSSLLAQGRCGCGTGSGEPRDSGACAGQCQTAYSCFYNFADTHPFVVSKNDHSHYFAHLYPHLGKLERLSKEAKLERGGFFENVANLVFTVLLRHCSGEHDSVYRNLSEVIDQSAPISSMSLGHHVPEIHEELYLNPCEARDLNPVKVYDRRLVRYLFCDSLQVGRLFQATTTFNYIVANTAPRYTIERIMLLNVTGPGEGKSYANNVLSYQFRRVRGCIETLTSFTPQAFKYKQNRNACVVMIDDAHITHEKNTRAVDKESNVIPNTFKNLLDTSVLESDVVTKDALSGKVDTVKFQAVHNCGFVWNTNTMGFVSDAWADRCLIMESEFPERVARTRSTKQIRDTVEERKMDRVAEVCLCRQNLIQSTTMIADSEIMQFGARFDKARDACLSALHATHVVCANTAGQRVSFCINQLVFAEAMKLACHFVFDVWIPPWTEIPVGGERTSVKTYARQLDENRLRALDRLSFAQVCLETNAVYKLCAAACLPDICPRVLDAQARFALKVLGYVLTQTHAQELKTSAKDDVLCVSGVDGMFFSEEAIRGGTDSAHEMIMLCSACKVPARDNSKSTRKLHKLCTYRLANRREASRARRGQPSAPKRVSSVAVPLETVYDVLALCAPQSHRTFWYRLSSAVIEAYKNESVEDVNAFAQCRAGSGEQQTNPRLSFSLDFDDDPVQSLILEATAAVSPLDELAFSKTALGGETFRCSAPLHYGSILVEALGRDAPDKARDERHARESKLGPSGTFHGPRLSVYSPEYSGVPVENMSTFCTTRTVYHQDRVLLNDRAEGRENLLELEEDWEWKDAADVFNRIHGDGVFTVDTLKRQYASTMIVRNGEDLKSTIRALRNSDGQAALDMRKCVPHVRETHLRDAQLSDAASHDPGHRKRSNGELHRRGLSQTASRKRKKTELRTRNESDSEELL